MIRRTNLIWILLPVLAGCGHPQPTYAPAPPMATAPAAPPIDAPGANAGVFNWRDVPANQRIPIVKSAFDQGGYQIYANTGEIIVVPFENNNLHVMQFGRSDTGQTYFVNDNGTAPILYLPPGGYVENTVAQGARWYPLPDDFNYTRPVYVAVAPTWADYTAMGWYPGMAIYGGMWGYRPGLSFAWMPGFYVNVGGTRYTSYVSYHNYYTSTRGYAPNRVVYTNYNARPSGAVFGRRSFQTGRTGGFSGSGGSFRSGGSSGSFNGMRTGGFSAGRRGSFAPGGSTGFSGSGGGSFRSGGSFNSGRSSGSFSTGSGGGSFRSSGGSFRSSGGSFRSSGGSFGSSRGRR